MRKINYIVIIVLLILIAGCNTYDNVDIATKYIDNKGYNVLSYEGNYEKYTLMDKTFTDDYRLLQWSVQEVSPIDYFGETVYVEKFIVDNHPLDHWESGRIRSLGKTELYVYIINNQVVGGISMPVLEVNNVATPVWSLEGKTIKEIHSISYDGWKNNLLDKLQDFNY